MSETCVCVGLSLRVYVNFRFSFAGLRASKLYPGWCRNQACFSCLESLESGDHENLKLVCSWRVSDLGF